VSKAGRHIEDLVSYFGYAGGRVHGGSLDDVGFLVTKLEGDAEVVARQLQRNLNKVKDGLLLVADNYSGSVLGAGLGYAQDDCFWVCDLVSSGKVRGTGTALMREFARRAQELGLELRLEAYRDSGSLSYFDMLGGRTVDHHNKRALGWKASALNTLAGEKAVEAPSV
jgi:hypothetical protein